MTDDDNIRRNIEDGDWVKSVIHRGFEGTAFIKNKSGQWLVVWKHVWLDGKTYGGYMDIVHQDNLERL